MTDFLTEFTRLPPEVAARVFSYLSPTEAARAGLVCRAFRAASTHPMLWREFSARGPSRIVAGEALTVPLDEYNLLYRELNDAWSTRCLLLRDGVSSSSCDDSETQHVNQTLVDDRKTFWSSTGSASPESDEWLVYRFHQPLCAVLRVDLRVYRGRYQRGQPTYAPMGVSFSLGHSPNEWHWTSEEFSCAQDDSLQSFRLPAIESVGGFLRVNLRGKRAMQPGDSQYYTVISHVRAVGLLQGSLVDSFPILADALLRDALKRDAFRAMLRSRSSAPASFPVEVLALKESAAWKQSALPITSDYREARSVRDDIAAMVAQGRVSEAIDRAIALPHTHALRQSRKLVELFKSAGSSGSRISSWLLEYLRSASMIGKLTETESFALGEMAMCSEDRAIKKESLAMTRILLAQQRLSPTAELGELFLLHGDTQAGLNAFLEANEVDRLVHALHQNRAYTALIRFCLLSHFIPDWAAMLAEAVASQTDLASRVKVLEFAEHLLHPSDVLPQGMVLATLASMGLPLDVTIVLSTVGVATGPGQSPLEAVQAALAAAKKEAAPPEPLDHEDHTDDEVDTDEDGDDDILGEH